MNDDEEGIAKGDPNKKIYLRPPDYPEIYETIDDSDEEMAASSYDQHIGAEVVLPDWKGDKLMVRPVNVLNMMTQVQAKLIIMTFMTSLYMKLNILMER